MIKLTKGLLGWLAVTGLAIFCSGNATEPKPETVSDMIDVTVGQLLKAPAQYSGKQIRVSGYWVRGFEWSKLCTDPKTTKSRIWIEPFFNIHGNDLFKGFEKQLAEAEKIESAKGEWFVAIVCEGLFEYGETYGHGTNYTSRLTIKKIIDFKIPSAR